MRVTVVGDVLLDRDVEGEVGRVCPDAPVPVLDERRVLRRPGGAGLTAVALARLRRLGLPVDAALDVALVTALGADDAAEELRELLADDGIDVHDVGAGGTTPEKVRLRAAGQSLLRLDRGRGVELGPVGPDVLKRLRTSDAVVVADYGRGVLMDAHVRAALELVRDAGVAIVWDPHPQGPEPIDRCALVTPNHVEAAARRPDITGDGLAADAHRARALRSRWGAGAVAVTLGHRGVVAATGDGTPLVVSPERSLDAIDPCGAGDVFAATAAVCLAQGALLSAAVHDAVHAATSYLASGGAAALATPTGRGPTRPRGEQDAAPAPPAPRTVATGGCFDVLHPGHLALLRAASRLGDRLVVLVNSDASVRRLKGPGRPVHHEQDRLAALGALRWVDDVVLFDEDTPVDALRCLRPAVFVKGGDYTASDLPEAAVMAEWGGAAVTVPYLEGHSTTGILERAGVEERAHVV